MPATAPNKRSTPRVRVLLLEPSAMLRHTWSQALALDGRHEVISAVATLAEARMASMVDRPDVLVLNVDGLQSKIVDFIAPLMRLNPLPVILIASAADAELAIDAMAAGALHVVTPPSAAEPVDKTTARLVSAVIAASLSGVHPITERPAARPQPMTAVESSAVVAIGAGLGGVRATFDVLSRWPVDGPAVVVAQHLPVGFTGPFARAIQNCSAVEVAEARTGDVIHAGRVLVAPAGMHTLVRRERDRLVVQVKDGPALYRNKPSIDVLFDSLAKVGRGRLVAAVLSGAGFDGAAGLLSLRKAGARTLAESQSTSVVSAMPFAATTAGGADETVDLCDIASTLVQWSARESRSRSA